jgi:hypothetical protein
MHGPIGRQIGLDDGLFEIAPSGDARALAWPISIE